MKPITAEDWKKLTDKVKNSDDPDAPFPYDKDDDVSFFSRFCI